MDIQQTVDNVYVDWLGNQVMVDDWVLYSSKSTNVGMNLGKVEYVGPSKNPNSKRRIIQVRVHEQTHGSIWSKRKLVTLSSGDGAYRSVTRYIQGLLPPNFMEESNITPDAKTVPAGDFVCDLGPEEPEARAAAIQDWEDTNRYPD